MSFQQPLKEKLHRIINDLDVIVKQLAEIMTVPRDQRTLGQEASVIQLVELFKNKEKELDEGMKIGTQIHGFQSVV